jgi:hypothetical protein
MDSPSLAQYLKERSAHLSSLPLIASMLLGFWAFQLFGENLFTAGNVMLWFLRL